ncbi:ETC complex I subunit conserved region domain-containing protein [Sarocladium implicatum]|nr:ETC complex I subunit conserved region domain-containing protein [Sarocladium implicatum]
MASLRTQSAARMLRAAATPASRVAPRRWQSSATSAPATVPAPNTMNQPDYNIQADKATSTFTPVPKRVQEGTEDILPAAIISGAPMELQARTVRIYKEAKPATQSGDFRGKHWRMDWDVLAKGHRWENPLMGWQSSGDFMQGTNIHFHSKEDAIAFAEKQGYEYFVQEPNSRKITPKAYANNFLYSARKLKHIRAK